MDATAKLWDVETGEEVATLTVSCSFFSLTISKRCSPSFLCYQRSHLLINNALIKFSSMSSGNYCWSVCSSSCWWPASYRANTHGLMEDVFNKALKPHSEGSRDSSSCARVSVVWLVGRRDLFPFAAPSFSTSHHEESIILTAVNGTQNPIHLSLVLINSV